MAQSKDKEPENAPEERFRTEAEFLAWIEEIETLVKQQAAPRVGDIVHFFSIDSSRQTRTMGPGPYAAVVTCTHGDVLDLWVMSPSRSHFPVFAVPAGTDETLSLEGTENEVSCWWRSIA